MTGVVHVPKKPMPARQPPAPKVSRFRLVRTWQWLRARLAGERCGFRYHFWQGGIVDCDRAKHHFGSHTHRWP